MPILYKKAKEAVNKQYDELISRGYVPTLNADKETYSWVHKDTGEKYRGIDPTGGIDVDAGFGDVLKRNRRQRRLMSEKAGAAALENEQNKKLISVSSSGTTAKSDKEIELEKRIKELEDMQKKRDVVPPVTPVSDDDAKKKAEEAAKKAEEDARKLKEEETRKAEEDKTAEEAAKKAEEDRKHSIARNIDIGFYTGTADPTVPYIYVEDKDLKSMRSRVNIISGLSNLLSPPGYTSAESKHRGATTPILGLQQDVALPKKITKDGKSYTLLPNPDFKERTYNVEDLDYVKTLYGDNASIRSTVINGKSYLHVTPGLAERTSNAANWLENFVFEQFIGASKVNLKTLKGLKPVVQSTKTAATAGTAAETVSGTAQSAAERELANEAAKKTVSKASTSAESVSANAEGSIGGPAGTNPVNGQYEFNFEGGIPKGTYAKPVEGAGNFAGRTTISDAQQMKFSFTDPNEAAKQAEATAARAAARSASLRGETAGARAAASRAASKARNINKATTQFKDGGKVRFTFTK